MKKTFITEAEEAFNPAEQFITQPTTAKKAKGKQEPAPREITITKAEPKSRRVQLLMQPSLYEEAKEAAKKRGQSFNNFVAEAIELHLK